MAYKPPELPKLEKRAYQDMVDSIKPKPTLFKNVIAAFVVGGLISVLGQVILNLFTAQGLNQKAAAASTSAVLVFLAAFFTGLGIYDTLGKFGGAGSIVPITGFANSMVAPAIEFKREGMIFGVGARLFSIAGPVLVYGFVISWLIGLAYFIFQ